MIHINTIEDYFNKFGYPNSDIEIMQGAIVPAINAKLFVSSCISTLRNNSGNNRYISYYTHLLTYYKQVRDKKLSTN